MKKALKFLLATSSLALCTAGVSPFIVSCASSNSKNDFDYDANNQQLEINKSKLIFPDANNNLFTAYNDLLETNKTKSNAQINEKLTSVYSQWLKSLGMEFGEIEFDFANITIDGFSILIPTTIKDLKVISSSDSKDTPTISCDKTKINFSPISLNNINDLIDNNIYTAPATQLFPGYSLEDIEKLPEQNLLEKIPSLPTGTTIFKGGDNFPLPTYSIIKTNDGGSALRVLIFTPNKAGGLGQILITQSNLDIAPIQPNQEIKNALGDDVKNNWQEVVNKYMVPISEQDLTSISGTSGTNVITSYEDAQNSSLVTQKIANYMQDVATFKSNLENDLDFFLKNYLTSLSTTWDLPGLITSGVFTSNNLTIDETNKLLTGSVAIMLNNSTTGTKKIALPITNQEILVNGNSILTILIGFDKSSLSPYLVTQDAEKNTAYLTTAFDNVSLNVYQNQIDNSSTEIEIRDGSNALEPIVSANFTESVNVFPYSYAMKTLVTNVGFGNNLTNSTSLINESLKKLKVDDLKNLQLTQINKTYQNVLVGVKAAQNLLLKIAENPTLFDFLQDINQDLYDVFYLITNDADLSSIVSDLFSTKKVSEYLYTNLSKVISLLKKLVNTYPQLSTVLNMLETIGNTNQTLAQMQEWVKSIESLYPTLEKLLGDNVQWIMPLLKTIMTSLSNDDPSIVSLIFNNVDDVFQFLLSTDNASNLDANVVKIVGIFNTYLSSLAEFSAKQVDASKDPNKYKNIKVLDVLVHELTTTTKDSTLLKSIATVLQIVQPDSSIASVLESINSMIGSKIVVPSELKDYSEAKWQNQRKLLSWTYKVETATIKTVSLTSQLQKIIKSLINVTVNDKLSDLYTALSSNVQTTTVKNDFSYNSSSATVTQNLSLKMNFKETVKFDLMPLLVLLDNVTGEVSLSSTIANEKATASELTEVSPGTIKVPTSILSLNINLATTLPTDIVIMPDNYLQFSYVANNAKVRPNVNTNTGMINWAYQSTEQIAIAYESQDKNNPLYKNGVLAASNTKYTTTSATSSYYGSTYSNSSKTKFLGVVAILTVYLTDFISFNGGLTNYVTASTNLTNGTVIPNYNSSIYSEGATVEQLKSDTDFTTYLTDLINNYGQWTDGALSKKPEFSLKDGNDLNTKIKEYFKFGNDFSTNKYISYEYGFNASHYKLMNDKYTYTFNLIFSTPVLYKSYGSTTSSLVTNLTFTVTSSKAPTPTTPADPATNVNN